MNEVGFSVPLVGVGVDGGQATSAKHYEAVGAAGTASATLVLAHGAGAPQSHPWMVAMARTIAQRGIEVVTFNFLYTEARRRAPDKPPVLEATWRAAIEAVRARCAPVRLGIGGKSMGGRIATQVAAGDDVQVDRLVLLGYPLHPPGKPEQLRVKHLPRVRAPMLFVQGSRDVFGTPEELTPHLAGLASGTRLLVIDGGDHSLGTPKRGARASSTGPFLASELVTAGSLDQTMARVADEIARFMA